MTTYDFFGISTEVWNAMSSEQQAALESAAAEASTYSLDIFKDLEADGKQKLADAGMEFIDIDVDSFRACMDKFYELAGWTDDFKSAVTTAKETYRANK